MAELKQPAIDFLNALGLPAPVVLGVILAGFLVKALFDYRKERRELHQKEMEGSLRVLKELGTEADDCLREVLIGRVETEEFKLATNLSVESREHRRVLANFVKRHHDHLGWRTLKRCIEFWKVEGGALVLLKNWGDLAFYRLSLAFGAVCGALGGLSLILGCWEAFHIGNWSQSGPLVLVGIETVTIFFSLFWAFGFPLISRRRIQKALGKL